MPVLEYHLVTEHHTDSQIGDLLAASSELCARTLESPNERVRVFAHLHKPQHIAVAGKLLSEGGSAAPYFYVLVLQGRSIGGLNDLVVAHLQVDRGLVRGACLPIPPKYWAFEGNPANRARTVEIAARVTATHPV